MLKISNGTGVHPLGESRIETPVKIGTEKTEKISEVYNQNKDNLNPMIQVPTESEEDRKNFYIAKFMAEGLPMEVALAQYEFLN
jgi:cell fate regulator YaaT (PSP1 superfamily)